MNFLHVLYLMTGPTRNEILLTFFINRMYIYMYMYVTFCSKDQTVMVIWPTLYFINPCLM